MLKLLRLQLTNSKAIISITALSVSTFLPLVIPTREEEDSVVVEVEVVDVVVDEVALEIVADSVVVVVEVVEEDEVHPVVAGVDVVECLHSKEGRLHSKPRLSGTLISLT